MEKGILIAAYVEGIRSRKDKTVALTIGTNELTPEKAGDLFSLNGKLITAYLSVNDIGMEDMEIVDSIEPDLPGKTPSQRLRNVLYVMWEQNSEGYTDHNLHYLYYMDKMINHYKSKLKPK